MFTTRHGNGHLHSRPMTTQNKALGADDSLWFFMSKSSGPVDDLKANPVVGLIYADPSSDTYVSVSGTAAMLEDTAKKKQLWNKPTEAWFPGGPTDPDLALVQVRDRPRQLLGREGKQAGPALRDGQGGRHRQAAADSASTAKCACADARATVTARPRRDDLARRAAALFRASWSAARPYRVVVHCQGDRHAPRSLHAPLLARLPLADAAGAIEWEELPSLAQRVRQRRPGPPPTCAVGRHPARRARARGRRRSRFASR